MQAIVTRAHPRVFSAQRRASAIAAVKHVRATANRSLQVRRFDSAGEFGICSGALEGLSGSRGGSGDVFKTGHLGGTPSHRTTSNSGSYSELCHDINGLRPYCRSDRPDGYSARDSWEPDPPFVKRHSPATILSIPYFRVVPHSTPVPRQHSWPETHPNPIF